MTGALVRCIVRSVATPAQPPPSPRVSLKRWRGRSRKNVTDDIGNMDTDCATYRLRCNSVWSMTGLCIGSELGTATPGRTQRPLPPRFPPLQLRARSHGTGRRPRASLGPHHEARRCCQGAISVSLVALHRPSCRMRTQVDVCVLFLYGDTLVVLHTSTAHPENSIEEADFRRHRCLCVQK